MKVVLLVDQTSPVWPWLMGLLRNAGMREAAEARMRQSGQLDIHRLGAAEVQAWGELAVRARGPN